MSGWSAQRRNLYWNTIWAKVSSLSLCPWYTFSVSFFFNSTAVPLKFCIDLVQTLQLLISPTWNTQKNLKVWDFAHFQTTVNVYSWRHRLLVQKAPTEVTHLLCGKEILLVLSLSFRPSVKEHIILLTVMTTFGYDNMLDLVLSTSYISHSPKKLWKWYYHSHSADKNIQIQWVELLV